MLFPPHPSTASRRPSRPACPGTPIPRLSQPGQGREFHESAPSGLLLDYPIFRRLLLVLLLALSSLVQAEVSMPNGDWREEDVEEFRVPSIGGQVRVLRDYVFNKWQINGRWNALSFEADLLDGSVRRITRNEAIFERQGDAYVFGKRALIRPQTVQILPAGSPQGSVPGDLTSTTPDASAGGGVPLQNAPGYRWLNRNGDWIDYDSQGKIVAYGNRNNARVWFEYGPTGTADAGRIVAVRDHFARTLLSYRYTPDGYVSEVKDAMDQSANPRRIQLTWSGGLLTRVTNVLGNVTTYTYENNRLKTLTDPEQHTLTLTYGPTGRVQKVTAPGGGEVTYQYDYDKLKRVFYIRKDGPTLAGGSPVEEAWFNADGKEIRRDINGITQSSLLVDTGARVNSLKDLRGQTTTLGFDEFDNPVKLTQSDGSAETGKYSPLHGGLLETQDELGVKTQFSYDSKGNVTQQVEAVGLPEERTTDFAFDPWGRLLSQTQRGRNVTLPGGGSVAVPDATVTYQWNERSLLIQTRDPLGNITRQTSDSRGYLTTTTDALGNNWTIEPDAAGHALRQLDPLGNAVATQIDKIGLTQKITDPQGKATTYAFDPAGRLNEVKNALAQSTRQEFTANNRRAALIDADGNRHSAGYDLFGRLVETRDANNNAITYDYGTDPVLIQSINYPTFTRRLTWDTRGRPLQTQDTLNATVTTTLSRSYDAKNRQIRVTDRNGRITTLDFDNLGRLIQTTDPAGGQVRRTYDPWGRILAITDPNGASTTYGYDAAGRRISETRPGGARRTWSYDAVGNLIQAQDAKGNLRTYTYDTAGRPIQETHTLAGAASPSRTITTTYNLAGAITGYTDIQGSHTLQVSYTLDDLNRKTGETRTLDGRSHSIQTSYTSTGRLASLTWPDGYRAQYTYDANQNLSGLSLPEGSLVVSAQRWNQPTQIQLPNGVRIDKDYDPLMRPTQAQAKTGGGAPLLSQTITYDPESNLLQKATDNGTQTYQYDTLDRLTQADIPTLGKEKYSYDAVGNRLTDNRTDGLFSAHPWTYDADGKLTQSYSQSAAPITNTWDENGNLSQRSSSDPLQNKRFLYDAAGQLAEVQDANGAPVARYLHDPDGRRIQKVLYQQDGQVLATPRTTDYLYSDQGLIAELDDQGAITRRYGWKPDTPWGTDPIFFSARRTGADPASSLETFYALNDSQGTPQKLVDAAGAVVWEGRASAFGETQVQPGAQVDFNLRLAGQYYDAETRTHDNWHRTYDPAQGRYLQADPIGLEGGLNRYGYGLQSPLRFSDPLGLEFDSYQVVSFITGGWTPSQGLVNAAGGMGDAISMGLTKAIRDRMGLGGVVDECSDAYEYGEWAGMMVGVLSGRPSGGAVKAAGRLRGVASELEVLNEGRYAMSLSANAGAKVGIMAEKEVVAAERFLTREAEAGSVVGRTAGSAEGAAAKSTVQANRAAGDAFEQQIKGQLQQVQSGVVQQVTVKTQSGVRTRIDLIGRDVNGNVVCTECKASATAPLTSNQKVAFPEIRQSGAIVVGKGKPGFPGGTQIPPTTVNIVRP